MEGVNKALKLSTTYKIKRDKRTVKPVKRTPPKDTGKNRTREEEEIGRKA